ncbi:FAD-binding oxidoreductase [Bradyrhizobium sp. JR3.5]
MTATDAPLQQPSIAWQTGRVQAILAETSRVKSIILQPATWSGHWPGQHVDIRLTAEDGYQAERSYSIASPPEEKLLTLTVERVDDGEVSSYLLDELRVGDALEFRGPIGRHFIWNPDSRWADLPGRGRHRDYAADGDAASPRQVARTCTGIIDLFGTQPGRRRVPG